jgi:hypothetical protein
MLKFKFKKMLKESREQTDRNALAVIRTEFSKSVPNLDLVLNLAKESETLMGYVETHLKDLGIKEIDERLSEGSWGEAWDAVSYDPEGEIEYALEVRIRLAKYFIEQLKDYSEDPRIPLMQLKDIDEDTPVEHGDDTDYSSARYTIDYEFLPEDLQIELINAIDGLVDYAKENAEWERDWEDTKRSTWYY